MKITKQQALKMLKKLKKMGEQDRIAEAERTLPDPIDIRRDASLLARFGLERSQLLRRFGDSP